MTETSTPRARYLVTVEVKQSETYAIIADSEEEARATAWADGELIDSDTHSVDEISVERDADAFDIEIEAQPMLVLYRKAYFGAGTDAAVDRFEFHSPHNPPRRIPVSETGFRSHWVQSAIVADYGEVGAFARELALALLGTEPQQDDAQGGLFS
jgi:hypothetical protein